MKSSFIDRGLQSISIIKETIGAPPPEGPLRHIRPEIKLFGTLIIIVLATTSFSLKTLLGLGVFLFLIVVSGGINLFNFYRKIFILTFLFGFLLSFPSALNLFVEGDVVIRLFRLSRSYDIWIYHIPEEIGITSQGLERTGLLTLRVLNTLGATFLLLKTSTFEEIITGLKRFRIPSQFLTILMLSYRYILIFSKTVEEFYLAKKARFLGRADRVIIENWIAGRIHFLFKKTKALAEEVTLAMKARGMDISKKSYSPSVISTTVTFAIGTSTVNHPDTIFRLEGITHNYEKNIPAIRDVSFEVKNSERLAIIGANGSGKSTLLKIIAGLIYPSSGKVLFNGQEVSEKTLKDTEFLRKFRSAVGYVFQDPDIQLFSATVYDELMYGPLQLGLPEDEIRKRVEHVLDLLEISHLKDRPPYMLSGGEKKRVAIGSILTMNPEILILDEPTTGLDPKTQCFLLELILYLNMEAQKTIIIATHDLSLVDELQARVVVLSEEHRIEKIASANEVLSDEKLLLKVNLIHEHLHYHGDKLHRHLHAHCFFHKH